MPHPVPAFQQLNLVVRDMDAALAFYRTLGLPIRGDAGDWPPGSGARHAEVEAGDGPTVEFDNEAGVRLWHAGWRASGTGARAVIGFRLPSDEAVDELYATVTAAGYPGRQPPHDAFWGARYAVVGDPEGNDVGLMGPIDRDRAYTPGT
jgi:catechol 2,3-dioxygenase-like lactoylglutathione lyase family enzyme